MKNIPLGKYAPYYKTYVDKVKQHPVKVLNDQLSIIGDFLNDQQDRLDFKYAPEKWTIRQVMMHLIDTEQVFAYRLLRISRGDTTPLPGFNQNVFIDGNDFTHLNKNDLLALFRSRREATIHLIESLTTEQLLRVGIASESEVSAGSLIYMMAGHVEHHWRILQERYMENT